VKAEKPLMHRHAPNGVLFVEEYTYLFIDEEPGVEIEFLHSNYRASLQYNVMELIFWQSKKMRGWIPVHCKAGTKQPQSVWGCGYCIQTQIVQLPMQASLSWRYDILEVMKHNEYKFNTISSEQSADTSWPWSDNSWQHPGIPNFEQIFLPRTTLRVQV